MAETEDDVVALRAEEVKRLRETVDILTARHEAGLEDRDRLRNERDEARAEVERSEPRRQRDERDLADAFSERDRLRAELDELHTLVARQAAILTGVANALRGPPGPLASHSHHDLAERAAEMAEERRRGIAVRLRLREALDGIDADHARVKAERDEAMAALARRDAEYLELARRSDARGFELRASQVETHTARRSLATLSAAVRRERDTRAEWLDSLPDGSCGNPPPNALIEAEDATGVALRAVEAAREAARG